jgi:DNA-binding winged helix-turn-helix (wHTH) protein
MQRLPFAERHEEPDEIRRPDPRSVSRRSTPAATEPGLEFGRFYVSLRKRELFGDNVRVKLGTRAFDVLVVLLEANGSLVAKTELLKRAWPGIVVGEDNLKVQISELRRALAGDRDFIRTECGRGYRLTAEVRRIGAELPEELPAPATTALSSGGRKTDYMADFAAIAARLAAIEAKLAIALDIWTRQPGREAFRSRRRRSCDDRAGRIIRPGQQLAAPSAALDRRQQALPSVSPA